MNNLVVLASHGGSILQTILSACDDKLLNAKVTLVISNNSAAKALRRAEQHGVATLHLSAQTHPNSVDRDKVMLQAIEEAKADWVVLAGYMKKLGGQTLERFSGRIINTHPALLPKYGGSGFYGRKVHEAVLAAQDTESGATVHLVDGDYDTGAILSQVRVAVHPDDSVEALEERVKVAERRLMIETLNNLIS
ncbi:MAG: phosphoribosylglycinamide formyltransferase [Pseudomonadales bacterium]